MARASRAVRGICMTKLDPDSKIADEVVPALEEYKTAGYQLGITALYSAARRLYPSRRQIEHASEIIEKGLATAQDNSERIFEGRIAAAEGSHGTGQCAAADATDGVLSLKEGYPSQAISEPYPLPFVSRPIWPRWKQHAANSKQVTSTLLRSMLGSQRDTTRRI